MPAPAGRSTSGGVPGTQVLDRAIAIVRTVAEHGGDGLSLASIIEATGLSRPTAYRLVLGLKRNGLLRGGARRGHYCLGYELLALGARAGDGGGLRQLARPALLRLAERFGDSFFLFVPDGYHALCLEVQDGDYPVRSFTRGVGGRVPMGAGQASIAILAYLPEAEREEILARNAVLLKRDYGLEPEDIARAIATARARGYSRGAGGRALPEYTGLGVPLLDAAGYPVAALSCSALASRLPDERCAEMALAVRDECERIARTLGTRHSR